MMGRSSVECVVAAAGWAWLSILAVLGLLGVDVRRPQFEAAGLVLGAGFLLIAARLVLRPEGAAPVGAERQPSGASASGVAIGSACVAGAAFGWSLGLGPLSDDFVLARWATTGDWLPAEWSFSRPLPLFLWTAIRGTTDAWTGLHVLNVATHAVNSGLVALLARRRAGTFAGLAAGALFAAFPASAEAVAWNAGIFDLLATLFALIAVFLATSTSAWSAWLLLLACIGGVLSKESAVVIPALVALEFLFPAGPPRPWRAAAVPVLVSGAVAAVFLVTSIVVSPAVSHHWDSLPGDRRQVKDLVVRPFAALAVPLRSGDGLHATHYVAGLCVLLLLGFTLARTRSATIAERNQASRTLAWGIGWVAATALPLLSQFYVSPTLQGSRYLYMPCAGFVVALTASVAGRPGWRALVPWTALATLLAVFAVQLNGERRHWSQAATVRDSVLVQATMATRDHACASVSVSGVPEDLDGVYVFRQGLTDALGRIPSEAGGTACHLRWTEGRFVRVE